MPRRRPLRILLLCALPALLASAPGSRRIQVSAAYAGDPRRARSEPLDVPIVAPLLASLRPAATPAG